MKDHRIEDEILNDMESFYFPEDINEDVTIEDLYSHRMGDIDVYFDVEIRITGQRYDCPGYASPIYMAEDIDIEISDVVVYVGDDESDEIEIDTDYIKREFFPCNVTFN